MDRPDLTQALLRAPRPGPARRSAARSASSELDRYVELELAGRDAEAAVPGMQRAPGRLPGLPRGPREPARPRRRRAGAVAPIDGSAVSRWPCRAPRGLVDQIVVIDSDSADATARAASERRRRGLRGCTRSCRASQPEPGKGEALCSRSRARRRGDRDPAASPRFFTGYAVEVGLLMDLWRHLGLAALAQADLGQRRHRHQRPPPSGGWDTRSPRACSTASPRRGARRSGSRRRGPTRGPSRRATASSLESRPTRTLGRRPPLGTLAGGRFRGRKGRTSGTTLTRYDRHSRPHRRTR